MSRRRRHSRRIHAAAKSHPSVVAISAPVSIEAAQQDGDKKKPARFTTEFYTGGPLHVAGWDEPVVVDLGGLTTSNVLVANLDHDSSKRVGNFSVQNNGTSLIAVGDATAATAARDEVIESAVNGYQWQSSLEVNPTSVEFVKAGESAEANGQTFKGPLYITRKGVLKGFAFVSHGADDNTTVSVAASAASSSKEFKMDKDTREWIEAMGFDIESLSAAQRDNLVADYEGRSGSRKTAVKAKSSNPFEARKIEAKRRADIRDAGDKLIELRGSDVEEIESIQAMCEHAIATDMSVTEFRLELYESTIPQSQTVRTGTRNAGINSAVVSAAICQAARLPGVEDEFNDQTLQAAHDTFKGRIGLKELILLAAENNGYSSRHSSHVDQDTLRAAFQRPSRTGIHGGFSTLDISTIVSATANKFIMRGWNSVDQTPLRISKIQNVRDFKTITTVSLTDSVIYEKLGAGGEIKHGTLSELTYTNKADTYAKMLAITRNDIINDDLGALTDVPMKLGNGAMKKLNDIFWTEFLALVGDSFFASGNANINTGVATMTTGGLAATETIFMEQTNPDGTPLGVMPRILLVPTALKSAAFGLMSSERLIDGTATATQGDANIWRGRFTVESSPYISNSSYTGYTAVGWWMLADPMELPVIAIAALNGRVEPTVDTADADFNTLGIQMRGYCDVGVSRQEYRGGVYADGGAS